MAGTVNFDAFVRGHKGDVVVFGYQKADRINADHGSWRDRGSEGYVRLVAEAGERRCWTQPRLVMPGATHG